MTGPAPEAGLTTALGALSGLAARGSGGRDYASFFFFTARLRAALPMDRQALHAAEMLFDLDGGPMEFRAPLAADMAEFWRGLGCP